MPHICVLCCMKHSIVFVMYPLLLIQILSVLQGSSLGFPPQCFHRIQPVHIHLKVTESGILIVRTAHVATHGHEQPTLWLRNSRIWCHSLPLRWSGLHFVCLGATHSHCPQTLILPFHLVSPNFLQDTLDVVFLRDSAFSSSPFNTDIYYPVRASTLLVPWLLGQVVSQKETWEVSFFYNRSAWIWISSPISVISNCSTFYFKTPSYI